MTNQIVAPGVRLSVMEPATSTAATGDKASYQAPAGKRATVTSYRAAGVDAGVEIALEFTSGGQTMELDRGAAGANIGNLNVRVQVEAGEKVALACKVAQAATAADFYIGVEEEA